MVAGGGGGGRCSTCRVKVTVGLNDLEPAAPQEAIVGIMGPPATPIISAIGDNVNVAARLESLTKEFGCAIVISETVAQGAGLDLTRFPRHEAETRGRAATIRVYAIPHGHELAP